MSHLPAHFRFSRDRLSPTPRLYLLAFTPLSNDREFAEAPLILNAVLVETID